MIEGGHPSEATSLFARLVTLWASLEPAALLSRPVPYGEHVAFVQGRAATGVAWLLHRAINRGELASIPPALHDETVAAIEAVELAARAWTRRAAADSGRTAARSESDVAHCTREELSTTQAAAVLRISGRRARDLAAAGMGRRVGGRWVLDRSAVDAEALRRGVA